MDLKDLKVELIPHIGYQRLEIGGEIVDVEVRFDQCRVQVNGQYKAIYCGKADVPNKHLSFVEALPMPVQEAVAEKVAKITGGIKKFTAPLPEEHEVVSDVDE